jgi:hypothetical protein
MTIIICFRKEGFVITFEQPAKGLDEEEMEEEDWKNVNIKSRNSVQRLCKL